MFPSVGYTLKREFSAYCRSLQHDKPQEFTTSQWQRASGKSCLRVYFIYKWTVAIYMASMMGLDMLDLDFIGNPERLVRIAKWPVYLTAWNTTVITVQAVLCAILVAQHHFSFNDDQRNNQMTSLHKAYWVVHNLSNALSPAVTMLYWTAVYNSSHSVGLFNIHKHLLNTVFVIVDLMVNSHPIRILHVYQPVILGASYGAFTWIYYLCGGTSREHETYIYSVLNWRTPYMGLITTLGSCALLVIIHTLLWLIHLARLRLARSIFTRNEQPSSPVM